MSGIFNSAIFNNAIFNVGAQVAAGVGKKAKAIRIRLSDIENRIDTAKFLKEQLRLRQGFPLAEIREEREKRAQRIIVKREAKMRKEYEEAQKAQQEQQEKVLATNNALLQIIAIAHDT